MFIYVDFLTSGASSPEWVKPTAEGGGICFRSICFWFVICSFVICLFLFLYLFLFLSTSPAWRAVRHRGMRAPLVSLKSKKPKTNEVKLEVKLAVNIRIRKQNYQTKKEKRQKPQKSELELCCQRFLHRAQ
jgi:hypothetical protein